jgi:hypothetical protein
LNTIENSCLLFFFFSMDLNIYLIWKQTFSYFNCSYFIISCRRGSVLSRGLPSSGTERHSKFSPAIWSSETSYRD